MAAFLPFDPGYFWHRCVWSGPHTPIRLRPVCRGGVRPVVHKLRNSLFVVWTWSVVPRTTTGGSTIKYCFIRNWTGFFVVNVIYINKYFSLSYGRWLRLGKCPNSVFVPCNLTFVVPSHFWPHDFRYILVRLDLTVSKQYHTLIPWRHFAYIDKCNLVW